MHISKLETLQAAYADARRNGGAAGVDGITFEQIESTGRDAFLTELAASLRSRTYRPQPLRRREIPKEGSKVRVISIPTIRDRVVQGAVRLILEPIFEADFSDSSYGARSGRSAQRLVRDRLDVLASRQAELLRWAAVLGTPFELELLAQLVASTPEIARALAARNDATERAAEIAHHGVLAGEPALAAHACLSAGRRCLRMFAPEAALSLARRGAVYAEQLADPERTALSIDLLCLRFDARRPSANDDLLPKLVELSARALDLGAIDHARRGFFMRARLTWERGEVADTRRFSRDVERISRLADPRERVIALADAARCLVVVERDLAEAEAFVLEAEEAVALDPASLPCVLPLARGLLSMYRGELERAHASFEQARQIAVRDGERIEQMLALEQLADIALQRGELEAAQLLAAELVALGARVRGGSEAPFARALLALVHYTSGATETPAELERALEALRLEDAKQRYAHLLVRAAEFERRQGAWSAALAHAREALRIAEIMERHSEAAIATSVLAAAEAASGGQATPQRLLALEELLERPLAADARQCAERALRDLRGRPGLKEKRHGTRHRRTNLR